MMKAEGQTGLQGYVEAAFWELEGLVGYSSKRLGHLVLMGAEVRASGTFMRQIWVPWEEGTVVVPRISRYRFLNI